MSRCRTMDPLDFSLFVCKERERETERKRERQRYNMISRFFMVGLITIIPENTDHQMNSCHT